MKYALSNTGRIEATPKSIGICQCCGSELVAKCGTQKIWHWAHKGKRNCDHWWENETQWHRDWKDNFPKEWQEVVHLSEDGEKHIADVKTSNGLVVEFQHSAISLKEKLSRETFYKDMIWVVDGRRLERDFQRFYESFRSSDWKHWRLLLGILFLRINGPQCFQSELRKLSLNLWKSLSNLSPSTTQIMFL